MCITAVLSRVHPPGQPDPNAVANIRNAREAGIEYVDVYIFPCPKCSKSASEQVKEMGRSAHVVHCKLSPEGGLILTQWTLFQWGQK